MPDTTAEQSETETNRDQSVDGSGADSHEHRPLASYAALSGAFVVATAGALIAARAAGKDLPDKVTPWDVLLAGAATHKISRIATKDRVTSFLRAPFVEHQEPSGHGEVDEVPRGRGLRRAVGELLVCPYCLGQWTAAGIGVGTVVAPRSTRLVSYMFAVETVADFLQLAYLAAEERASTS